MERERESMCVYEREREREREKVREERKQTQASVYATRAELLKGKEESDDDALSTLSLCLSSIAGNEREFLVRGD